MLQISAELLAISSDAAVLVKNGKVVFANSGAMALLGRNCVGKSVKSLFGADIAGVQATSFIGDFSVNGKSHIVREISVDGIKAMFISIPQENETLINDAFTYSLRNCLMNMDVALNLLRSQIDKYPGLRESITIISHDCYRINRILTNVGLIQTLRQNKIAFAPVEMDISAFLRDLTDSINLLIGGKIIFSAPEKLKLFADPTLLEVLMLNLISNALIHAEGCEHIKITLSRGKDRCIIAVDDDGCGIEPDGLHKVFGRYKHGFDASDINYGPGLGMTVVRSIAGLHGGTLLLESRPGIGTAVRVSLSKNPYPKAEANEIKVPYEPSMKSLLTGLAHCLPSKFFEEKYIE